MLILIVVFVVLFGFQKCHALTPCDYTTYGYHVILDHLDMHADAGRAACQSFGWDYAVVPRET